MTLGESYLNVLWPVHNGLLRYTGFDVYRPAWPTCPAASARVSVQLT